MGHPAKKREKRPHDRSLAKYKGIINAAAREEYERELAVNLLREKLGDRDWRLRNLYYIIDKDAKRVLFQPNEAQGIVSNGRGHKTVVLKIRQPGVTTGLCIEWLDAALFTPNLRIGIIADTLDNAKTILKDKILYPYDNLPQEIRDQVPYTTRNTEEFELKNGSRISIGTSFRSGTVQILHVTEYGEICAKHPQHAQEVKSGAMQAVPANGITVVESTAKGREGHFYEIVQSARKGDPSYSDWTFVFLAWWQIASYTRSEPTMEFPPDREYLDRLETQIGFRLAPEQRRWWCNKYHELGEDVFAQFPGTPDEAFRQTTQGAYYGRQMIEAWQQGRIGHIGIDPNLFVETWWDIGMDDFTAIWFVQRMGTDIRCVDYYENSGEVLNHYVGYVKDWQARNRIIGFSRHIGPHDIKVREWAADIGGERRVDAALRLGLEFVPTRSAKELSLADGIDLVRRTLPMCRFDAERCKAGIDCLEHYRKEWNEMLGTYRNQPLHNWASHGADAFRTGVGYGDPVLKQGETRSRAAITPPPRRKVIM